MSEQLNIDATCHFCGQRLEGIKLSSDARHHLYSQAAEVDKALSEEVYQDPAGRLCIHCGAAVCRDDVRRLKKSLWSGYDKTPCPRCGQPLEDHLYIQPPPSAEYRALIDREIDTVLRGSESLREFFKRESTELRDDLKQAAKESIAEARAEEAWRQRGLYSSADGTAIEPPRRALLVDYWPGTCTSCGAETDRPITYVVYSAHSISQKVNRGGTPFWENRVVNPQEHPVRRCATCEAKANRLLGRLFSPHSRAKSRIEKEREKTIRLSYEGNLREAIWVGDSLEE